MTDKQINKFSDLTFTQFFGYDLVATFNNNSKIKELQEQLKAKEQECDRLKKIIDEAKNSKLDLKSFLVGEAVQNEYEQQLDQLKAEVKSKTEYIQEQRDIINQYSKEIEMYKKCQGKRASKREEELKAENDGLKEQLAEMISQSALLPKFFGLSAEKITQLATRCCQLEKAIEKVRELIQKEISDCEHCEDCESCEYNCCTKQILQICEVNDVK